MKDVDDYVNYTYNEESGLYTCKITTRLVIPDLCKQSCDYYNPLPKKFARIL